MDGSERTLCVPADYHQFYVFDGNANLETTALLWQEDEASRDRMDTVSGLIAVGTARNYNVPVTVRLECFEPSDDLSEFDHVTEASLYIRSKRLLVMGCLESLEDAFETDVKQGEYRVRSYHRRLGSVRPNGIDGDDSYLVVVWPCAYQPPKVLKRWNGG